MRPPRCIQQLKRALAAVRGSLPASRAGGGGSGQVDRVAVPGETVDVQGNRQVVVLSAMSNAIATVAKPSRRRRPVGVMMRVMWPGVEEALGSLRG